MELNLNQKNIPLLLTFTLCNILLLPALFPALHLLFFAPLLVVVYYQKSYMTSLWSSFFAGLLLDLLSGPLHFGVYTLSYTLTSFFLYPQKRHFFADSPTTLPLMTFFFSIITTMIEFFLVSTFELPIRFSLAWFFTDMLYFPFLDGAYAFFFFILPALLFGKPRRGGKDYFAS